jgi:hypothetical protein
MKIALCVSGQPRTWKKCYQSWLDATSHFEHVDIFFHMWDYNTLPSGSAQFTSEPLEDTPVTREEKQEIIETLKPVAYQFERARTFPKANHLQHAIGWWCRGQFYGLKKCAMLKREHEVKNKFEYDAVFRIRTDLLLQTKLMEDKQPLEPNSIYTTQNFWDPNRKLQRVADTFFYGDSFSFDQVSNFHYGLEYIDGIHVVPREKIFPPEVALYFYMRSIGLKNHPTETMCKLVRSEEYVNLKGSLDNYESI